MKAGVRALGVAESYRSDSGRSTMAGAVVRADGIVDEFSFGSCTVGGTDATAAVGSLVDDCARPDVRYVLVGAVAPAWYNLLDLAAIHERADRPVLAVTFEASDGLEAALRDAFSGEELEDRLEAYRSLPPRTPVAIDDETVYVRAVGCDDGSARDVIRAFTRAGGRPEPIRVARAAARAGDDYASQLQRDRECVERDR